MLNAFSLNFKVVMFCLYNWLFRFYQYYGIFSGFTYSYIDIRKRQVKFYTWARMYACILNIIMLYGCINGIIASYLMLKYYSDIVISLIYFTQYITRLLIIVLHGFARFKEEQFIKKECETLENLTKMSVDKKAENIIILKMLLIFIWSIFQWRDCITCLIDGYWQEAFNSYIRNLLSCLPHYTLCYHSLVLCYFHNQFITLNNQLECDQVQKQFANIYKRISLILLQVNAIIGSTIFCILSYLLV